MKGYFLPMLVHNYSVPYFGRDVKFNTYLRNHDRCKTPKMVENKKSSKIISSKIK
jgi:hypothetical protein